MSLSRDVIEKIRLTYVAPFLNCAREAGISAPDALRTAFYLYHRHGELLLHDDAIGQIVNADKYVHENRLLTTSSCHASFLALARIYLDPESEQEEFPQDQELANRNTLLFGGDAMPEMIREALLDTPDVRIQSAIREICHDEMNPIAGMSEAEIRAMLTEDSGNKPNIMYALSTQIPLKIKKLFCGSAVRDEVPQQEIIASIASHRMVRLFPSLYQAVARSVYEYECDGGRNITPVWAVAYTGKIEDLKFGDIEYGYNDKPMTHGLCIRVSRESVTPLRGVLLQARTAFADYSIMDTVDMPQALTEHHKVRHP